MDTRITTLYHEWMEQVDHDKSQLVPVSALANPTVIQFSEAPLAEGKPIQNIATANFSRLIGSKRNFTFHWTQNNMIPLAVKTNFATFLAENPAAKISQPTIENYFSMPNSIELVICDMEEAGYGVFTKNKIREGTIVCTYTGEIKPEPMDDVKNYNRFYTNATLGAYFTIPVCVTVTGGYKSLVQNLNDSNSIIDASRYGNMGSFLQHLPTADEIQNEVDKEQIATSNLTHTAGWYQNYPCSTYVAKIDIEPNEILGFSYGNGYWQAKNINPFLFTKQGKKLRTFIYTESDRATLFRQEQKPLTLTDLYDHYGCKDNQRDVNVLLRKAAFVGNYAHVKFIAQQDGIDFKSTSSTTGKKKTAEEWATTKGHTAVALYLHALAESKALTLDLARLRM